MRTDYEERFALALKQITAYMSPAQLRRQCERNFGLNYEEALEMAYENVVGEAKAALRGYRPKRVKPDTMETVTANREPRPGPGPAAGRASSDP